MKRDDLLIFAAGLIVVLIISILANQPGIQIPGLFHLTGDEDDSKALPLIYMEFAQPEPKAPVYELFTIQLVENPFDYPRIYLPKQSDHRMVGSYKKSDFEQSSILPLFGAAPYGTARFADDRTSEWITIGVLEQKRGGLSSIFSIPTDDAWRIRTEVTADRYPDRAIFRYALCDTESGAILDGGEIMGPGERISVVFTTGKEMYFIIDLQNVDVYRIYLDIQK
ncbi:hypothetical protein RJ53_07960 [Methanocalculus chunghsingensis]|uniref:Uncharacterized protein n=1 Tax=Methanocalculus chunghsingensis TaxID=156457 RepID=A0A8J8B4K8_9EURY|nr:hypothetical protein [Methanocalculus chunghsingensis]MBR1369430.1 hypothetical protein [Methanocalculus chunghsingensis]